MDKKAELSSAFLSVGAYRYIIRCLIKYGKMLSKKMNIKIPLNLIFFK